jgi:hypothetical protein
MVLPPDDPSHDGSDIRLVTHHQNGAPAPPATVNPLSPGGIETLADPKFVGPGAIFDITALTAIQHNLDKVA